MLLLHFICTAFNGADKITYFEKGFYCLLFILIVPKSSSTPINFDSTKMQFFAWFIVYFKAIIIVYFRAGGSGENGLINQIRLYAAFELRVINVNFVWINTINKWTNAKKTSNCNDVNGFYFVFYMDFTQKSFIHLMKQLTCHTQKIGRIFCELRYSFASNRLYHIQLRATSYYPSPNGYNDMAIIYRRYNMHTTITIHTKHSKKYCFSFLFHSFCV